MLRLRNGHHDTPVDGREEPQGRLPADREGGKRTIAGNAAPSSDLNAGGTGARILALDLLTGRGDRVHLASRDHGLAYRIYRETQVWRARLDRALAPLCNRPINKLDLRVLSALRIGAVQLLILRTPSHAAVSATVEAMGSHRGRGFVNAVLRRLAAEGEPCIKNASPDVIWSHPPELVKRWTSRFGKDRTAALMEWNNSVPPIGGVTPGNSSAVEYKGTAGRYVRDYTEFPRMGDLNQMDIPEGVYIQDEANVIVARMGALLGAGGRVLEVGAAPGGKTHHLAGKADSVVSVDRSFERMGLWKENRSRLGWEHCLPLVALGGELPFAGGFDLVFIDAPCTNTGVYRRRSDARWNWSEELLVQCSDLQRELLRKGAEAVADGGVLFYSTCSLEPEEDQDQVEWFESSFAGFDRIPLQGPEELVRDGLISIFPPECSIDGIFAAAWRRGL